MKELVDIEGCCLVVTTGGTGPATRDVTPEATEAVCDRMMPGFGELMRAESLKFVPTAILSRQTAGLRGSSLIVNLPGKPKSIRECLDAVFPAIPYCIDLMEGPFQNVMKKLLNHLDQKRSNKKNTYIKVNFLLKVDFLEILNINYQFYIY